MKRIAILSAVAALAVAAPAAMAATPSPAASAPAAGAAAVKHYEGTIVSVNRSNRTFRLRDSERGTVRIRVTSRTRFQQIAGFSSLKRGMTRIEATVHRSGGSWVANTVERSGGGGKHSGNDD
jgi:hypothetical protein